MSMSRQNRYDNRINTSVKRSVDNSEKYELFTDFLFFAAGYVKKVGKTHTLVRGRGKKNSVEL